MRGASQNLIRKCYLLGNLMFSATSLGLVVRMSLSWYFSPGGGMRNLAIWTSVSLSPPWEIRAYPSRTSPRYIMYSHQRSESVLSMSCKEKKTVSFRNQQLYSDKYFSFCGGERQSKPKTATRKQVFFVMRWRAAVKTKNCDQKILVQVWLCAYIYRCDWRWLNFRVLPEVTSWGAFHWKKNSGWSFREFLVINYYKMEHHFPEFPEEKTTLLGIPKSSRISYRK